MRKSSSLLYFLLLQHFLPFPLDKLADHDLHLPIGDGKLFNQANSVR